VFVVVWAEVSATETPDLHVRLKLLVVALGLAVGLRVIRHGRVTLATFKLVQRLEELGDKLGSAVSDEVARHAKVGVAKAPLRDTNKHKDKRGNPNPGVVDRSQH
jgi:hypothetical protein